jgi:DNA primase
MAFPPGFLDELRSRVSLADLVGKRVRLTRKGREYGGLCPFHNEKTPSFYVVEDKGFFHCFGCGAHGDAIGYVMRSENLDFIEAIERLAESAGVQVPQQTPLEREKAQRQKTLLEALAAAAAFYEQQLWSPAGLRGREYLERRGLDEETMRRFRLGWAGDDRNALRRALTPEFPVPLLMEAGLLHASDYGGEPYDYFRERVIFPIGDRAGRVIAFGGRALGDAQPKYLNSPEHPLFEKGRVLYGLSAARLSSLSQVPGHGLNVIVTEGYMDVIALHRAGFNTAVAPLGTALTESHLAELWRLSAEPIICLDSDRAGDMAAVRVFNRALPLLQPGKSLRFLLLPSGEDPDSLISTSGAEAFASRLDKALPLSQFVWERHVQLGPLDTPERRADLEKRLMEEVHSIGNRSVQVEYQKYFRQRLYELGRPKFPAKAQRAGRAAAPALRAHAPPRPPSPGRRQREVLVGMLLTHTFLIGRRVEEIGALDFPEPELHALRQAIFGADVEAAGLDATALRLQLGQGGFAATVDAVLSVLAEHAGSLSRVGDAPAVARYCDHVIGMLRGTVRGKLAGSPAEDLTLEAWERDQATWEGEAQEGFSEDEFPPTRAEGVSPR